MLSTYYQKVKDVKTTKAFKKSADLFAIIYYVSRLD